MSSRAPSRTQIARAQWLLGVDAPESTDEIRRAWKERVARTHPDRNADRAGAATRVTAAFNQARELCEWWFEAGEAWPKPMPPEALRAPEPERAVRPAARTPQQNRSSFRAGDLVARVIPGRDPASEPVLAVRVHRDGGGRTRRARGRLVRGAGRPRPGRVRLPRVRPLQRTGRRAPRTAAVPALPGRSRTAGAVGAGGRARAARHPLTRARRPRNGRRARRQRSRGACARALRLGRGRRSPPARGAARPHARGLRARLRAVGRRLDGARRRRRQRALSAVRRRSSQGAPRRSRGPR